MGTVVKFFIFLVVLAVFAAVGVGFYAFDYYDGSGPLVQETTLVFQHGEKFESIADDLAQAGIIDHPLLFKAIAVASGDYRKFKAGEYQFAAADTPEHIMSMIAQGKVVIHHVTIAEGLTVQQIAQILNNEKLLTGDVSGDIKEGSLLPETYRYLYGDKRQDIIARMQTSMTALLAQTWAKRKTDLPFNTPEEALTLASIVEKETGVTSERGRVASVFINRLKKGMKLQSDPTTAYGLNKSGTDLTLADLQSTTPYNTYVIPALPPGPICNPGKASIEAALNPANTDDLYFVATGSGGHNFAATLAQHNENVKEYRQKMANK